jgi:hypothetical protein
VLDHDWLLPMRVRAEDSRDEVLFKALLACARVLCTILTLICALASGCKDPTVVEVGPFKIAESPDTCVVIGLAGLVALVVAAGSLYSV